MALIQSPEALLVHEGERVEIRCALESSNVKYTVEKYQGHWYNSHNNLTWDGIILTLFPDDRVYRSRGYSERFQLSRNITSNSYFLTIREVKINDSDEYICGIWGKTFGKGTQLIVTSEYFMLPLFPQMFLC